MTEPRALEEEFPDSPVDFDGHPGGCVYPNGVCTCPVLEHMHPKNQSFSGCEACAAFGEEALLRRADQIRASRHAASMANWQKAMGHA